MRICGIDPGYGRCGISILERSDSSYTVVYSDCIETNQSENFSARLKALGLELSDVFKKYIPEALAVETLFFSINKKTALNVAHARGIILYLAEIHSIPTVEYSPQSIKIATTGYGNSSKEQIITMLHKILPLDKKRRHDDEYDAIAVALTHIVST